MYMYDLTFTTTKDGERHEQIVSDIPSREIDALLRSLRSHLTHTGAILTEPVRDIVVRWAPARCKNDLKRLMKSRVDQGYRLDFQRHNQRLEH